MTAYEMGDNNMPVRKISTEKLQACVDLVASGILKLVDQARALDVNPDTIRKWKVRSNRGDPAFEAEFFGEIMQFARAYQIGERLAMLELKSTALQFSIHGRERRTLCQGQFVPKLDPIAFALDEPTRILCGYHPLAYALDEKGAVIWNTEHVDPPTGLLDRFLQTFPELQTVSTTTLNVRGGLNVGVGIMPKVDYTREPPPLPPAPVMPMRRSCLSRLPTRALLIS